MESMECVPFIVNGDYFKICNQDGNKITAECLKCPASASKQIKGQLTSTTNFRTHLKRVHPELIIEYDLKQKEDSKRRRLNRGRTELTPLENVTKDLVKSISKIDRLIMNFVIKGLHPLSIVDQLEFRELIDGLDSSANVMSRPTLVRRINDRFKEMVLALTKKLSEQKYLALTADAWTCDDNSRGYMGVTVHWINVHLERESAALCCRRFKGSHTYDKIAELLIAVTKEYDLPMKKIVKAITDNGSNFVKAFREFGSEEIVSNTLQPNDTDSHSEDEDEVVESLIEFQNISQALGSQGEVDIDEREIFGLPPHHRCSSHTLCRICTADIAAKSSRLQKSAFAKCYGIWNKSSRSAIAAEKVKDICGVLFTKPCPTRWNSLYDSLKGLLKQKDHINRVSVELKVPLFQDRELEFIEEYCTCVAPIAEALDRLQGEKNSFFGELIPVLLSVEQRLIALLDPKPLHCDWLPQLLLDGLQKRFQAFLNISMENKDAILASISHPYFKLRWIPQEKMETLRNFFIEAACSETSAILSVSANNNPNVLQSTRDEDFFIFQQSPSNSQEVISDENSTRRECYEYFNDTDGRVEMLHKYPCIRAMFVKYNTPLPSSGPVERLFSYSSMVFAPKRRRLSDNNFERLTLLKVNKY